MSTHWSDNDLEYLRSAWGRVSMQSITQKLGRSVKAVKMRAFHLRLGPHRLADDRVSARELIAAIYGNHRGGNPVDRWERYGLRVQRHRVNTQVIRVVALDDFWAWASDHRAMLNFSRFERGMLGEEPAWAAQKRRADTLERHRKRPWTSLERATLAAMLREHRYTFADLEARLGRTHAGISRQIDKLGIPDRPVPLEMRTWTTGEIARAVQMRRDGHAWEAIARAVGRSATAVRKKVGRASVMDAALDGMDEYAGAIRGRTRS